MSIFFTANPRSTNFNSFVCTATESKSIAAIASSKFYCSFEFSNHLKFAWKEQIISLEIRFYLNFSATTNAIHCSNWPITKSTYAKSSGRCTGCTVVYATAAARTATAISATASTTAAPPSASAAAAAATTRNGSPRHRYKSGWYKSLCNLTKKQQF